MRNALCFCVLAATLGVGEQALSRPPETSLVESTAHPLGAEGEIGSFRTLSDHSIILDPGSTEGISTMGRRAFEWIHPGQLLGSLVLRQPIEDARGRQVPPGDYTLRLALQPILKDHFGTSEHREFAVLLPSSRDPGTPRHTSQAILDESRKLSRGAHPIVFPMALAEGSLSALTSFVPLDGTWLLLVANAPRWHARARPTGA